MLDWIRFGCDRSTNFGAGVSRSCPPNGHGRRTTHVLWPLVKPSDHLGLKGRREQLDVLR